MDLLIRWTAPTPVPDCGYSGFYRRKGDTDYSLTTSGSTSGSTNYVSTVIAAPASYEGYLLSNCCSSNLSANSPFGVNGYSPLTAVISVRSNPLNFIVTVTSTYPNPYQTYISGTFTSTIAVSGSTSIPFTVAYPAGATSAILPVTGYTPASAASPITLPVISSITPVFNGGGSLQQYDPVNTPLYFMFYNSTSGTPTWTGSPTSLPSFTLDQFNSTAVDSGGNILSGQLLMSWAQESNYLQTSGGTIPSPYTQVNFIVKDGGNNTIGTLATFTGTLGLVNAAITLNRSSNLYPLVPSTQLMMITQWANGSTIISKQFYLP